MKQLQLFKRDTKLEFGGSLLVGKRHEMRPLSTKRPTHLVFKSANQMLLLRNRKLVEHVLTKFGHKFGLRVYGIGVHSDHVHASVRTPDRARYNRWVRAVTAELVRLISGLQWTLRPYTRIGSWGRDFRRALSYIKHNMLEGEFILDAYTAIENWRNQTSRNATTTSPQRRPRVAVQTIRVLIETGNLDTWSKT